MSNPSGKSFPWLGVGIGCSAFVLVLAIGGLIAKHWLEDRMRVAGGPENFVFNTNVLLIQREIEGLPPQLIEPSDKARMLKHISNLITKHNELGPREGRIFILYGNYKTTKKANGDVPTRDGVHTFLQGLDDLLKEIEERPWKPGKA